MLLKKYFISPSIIQAILVSQKTDHVLCLFVLKITLGDSKGCLPN